MIVVWFSCGVASAVAAKITLEKYDDVRVVNCPIQEEHSDNIRFLKDVERWLGVEIETATNKKFQHSSAEALWESGRFMSNVYGADCTRQLKKGARQEWVEKHHPKHHVLGFTFDERKRFERFKESECENTLPVLIDEKITKADCFEIVKRAGIRRPEIYELGFPNANCIGCVKATSPSYWNLVREKFPAVFEKRAKLSRDIGCRLVRVKGERIFLDDLHPDSRGRIKSWDCGVFCEEKP